MGQLVGGSSGGTSCFSLSSSCLACSCRAAAGSAAVGTKETAALKRLMAHRNNRFATSCWAQRNDLLASKEERSRTTQYFVVVLHWRM